jgi:hypothetical protein
MSYNSFRTTSREVLKNTTSRSVNPKERLVNIQKREKLKGLLITKFMKKYGIKNPEHILQEEISKFLEGEKLTDNDLKRLDEKLKRMLCDKQQHDNLKRELSNDYSYEKNKKNSCNNLILPDVNINKAETMSVRSKQSKHSRMSGASNLSKFNENQVKQLHHDDDLDEFDNLSINSYKPVNRLDFSKEGDEWNAIAVYNQKKFEEEKVLSKLKDKEIKRRTKDDLDNQIQQKLSNMYEEQVKNKEYDYITLLHVEKMNEAERQRQLEKQQKVLREKDNRDRQLKDEKIRKKKDILKEKKADKELSNLIV